MKLKKNIPHILLFVKIYAIAIVAFFCFRLMLFLKNIDSAMPLSESTNNVLKAFVLGLRFDVVVTGYILCLPFVVVSICYLFNKKSMLINKTMFYLILILFSISFLLCAIDIPFFAQFGNRLNAISLAWIDSPGFVFKMVVQEVGLWIYILPVLIFVFVFYKSLRRVFADYATEEIRKTNMPLKITFTVLFLAFMIVGIRGRLALKSPIKIGTAYFCDNSFLNQLGLNPVFTFMRSYIDSKDEKNRKLNLMDEDLAIRNVKKYLNIESGSMINPLDRNIIPDTINKSKFNVVIVIMEGMSAAFMTRYSNQKNLTPFLDSLANNSYYFENIYSAGMHTYNGIFSTLFSFPAIFRQQPMKESGMVKYNGIASTLKNLNYSTTFFTTHDGQFDNVQGFLKANDFDNIITETDYPADEIKSTLGVADDYMFKFSIPEINKLYKPGKPFLVTYMTASNHAPVYIPPYFKPKNDDKSDAIVEYADWSLNQFINEASKQSWFNNTLFVFVADHGANINTVYDIALDYHHTPLVFFAPKLLKEKLKFDCIGGQIDVYPTIMGILKQPYLNNTLGIDLLREQRAYIFFNSDDKYGVIDKENLLIVKEDGSSAMYKYQNSDKKNYNIELTDKAVQMNEFAKSNLQTFQYIINSKEKTPMK